MIGALGRALFCVLAVSGLAACSSSPKTPDIAHVSWQDLGIAAFDGTDTARPPRFLLCAECPGPTPKTRKTRHAHVSEDRASPKRHADLTPVPVEGRTAISQAGDHLTVTVHFAFDSFALPTDFKPLLRAALGRINSPIREITVRGYTDNIGGQEYNDRLALRRAMALRQALLSLDPPSLGIRNEHISVQGQGLCCYIAPNSTAEGRRLNRRATATITLQKVPSPTSKE